MAGLRNNNNTQNAQWADYVGDILRGAQPINQLVPQHPYLNDVPLIDELRHQNTHHVIPLTLDVAKKILSPITSFDYIHFITTHPSGIKDTLAWLVNASKLMTEFDDNGKIIFNLNALKYTKASYFEILGEKYIKITTSSPWLLEKLGKYIFSSRAPQSLASFACVSFGFPVILVGGAILLTGIVCTVVLNEIDAQCHLSEKLKYAIRDGLKRQQELDKWKRENMTPFMYVLNTPPVI